MMFSADKKFKNKTTIFVKKNESILDANKKYSAPDAL